MLEKFLPRQDFDSYEDFKANFRLNVPDRFNFAYDVVDGWAEQDDAKPALAYLGNNSDEVVEYTFGDMKRLSNRAANMLKAHGIRKGDFVMLILRQRVEVWVTLLALEKIGAIAIPATFQLTSHDIVYRANAAGIKMIITVDAPDIIAQVEAALPEAPSLVLKAAVGDNIPEGWIDYRKELQQQSDVWEKPTGSDYPCMYDPMILYFSSGTSGMPKMILHDYTHPIGHIITAKYWQRVQEGKRHMTASDSGWAKFGWGKIYGQWIVGAVIAAYDSEGHFTAGKLLRAIEKLKLHSFCAPPTIYRFLIKEDLTKYDFSTIERCSIAGEPLNPEVYNQWLRMTGLKLTEGFGQTEGPVLIANFEWFPIKPGSTGKFSPIFDFDIVNEEGKSCEDGVVGSIIIRHARSKHPVGLFREYYKNPEAMAASWPDDDYNTGDMAWRDADGYIWFEGRNDDVIKCSGYRIGPFEVESVLMEHPAVLECAITAYPDKVRGEVVKATIVLVKGRGYEPGLPLMKELQDFVKHNTAPYKYPRIITFVDSLPKTTSGKINRKAIREMDIKALAEDK